MFSFLLAVLQVAMIVSLFLFIPFTIMFRIYLVIKYKFELKKSLLIVLLPFSFGYFLYLEEEKQSKIYNVGLILFILLTIPGILFTIYQHTTAFINF